MERESLKNILNRWRSGASSFLPPPTTTPPRSRKSSKSTSPTSTPSKRGARKKARLDEPVTMSQQVGAASSVPPKHNNNLHSSEVDEFELDRMFMTAYNTTLVAPPSARNGSGGPSSSSAAGSPDAGHFRKSLRAKGGPPAAAVSCALPPKEADLTPVAAFDVGHKGSTSLPSLSSYRRLKQNDAETSDSIPQFTPYDSNEAKATEYRPEHFDDEDDEDEFEALQLPPPPRVSRSTDDFFDSFASFAPPPPSKVAPPIIDPPSAVASTNRPGAQQPLLALPQPPPDNQPKRPTIADMLDDAPPPPATHYPPLTPTSNLHPYERIDPVNRTEGANRMSSLMDIDGETAFQPQHHVDMFVTGATRTSNGPNQDPQLLHRHQVIPHQLGTNATSATAVKELNDAFAQWSLQLGDSASDTASPSQPTAGGTHQGIEVIQESDIVAGTKATEAHRRFDIIFEVQAAATQGEASLNASPGSGGGGGGPSVKCSHAHKMVLLTCTIHSLGRQLSNVVLSHSRSSQRVSDAGGSEAEGEEGAADELVPANGVRVSSAHYKGPDSTNPSKKYYRPQGNPDGDGLATEPSRVLAKSQISHGLLRHGNNNFSEEGKEEGNDDEGANANAMRVLVGQCGDLLVESIVIPEEDTNHKLPTFQVLLSDQVYYSSGLQNAVRTYGLRPAGTSSTGRFSQQQQPSPKGLVLFGVGFPLWALHVNTPGRLCLIQASVNVRALRVKAELGLSSGGASGQLRPFRFDDPLANDTDVRRNLFEEGGGQQHAPAEAAFNPLDHTDPDTGFAYGPYSLSTSLPGSGGLDDWFVPADVVSHIYGVYQQLLEDERQGI